MRWLLLFVSNWAFAGVIELGGSANYRSTSYDENNYVRSISYTGSLTYYFSSMLAIEANYTNGHARQVAQGPLASDPAEVIEDDIDMFNLDFVLALGGRDASVRPYFKIGAGYLLKNRYLRLGGEDLNLVSHDEGIVPSGGAGLAVGLNRSFNIKVGVEAWSSTPKGKHSVIDYAGRAGLGFIF